LTHDPNQPTTPPGRTSQSPAASFWRWRAVAAIGIGVVILVHGFPAQRIDTQASRNRYLEGQIALLEKQIDEIKKQGTDAAMLSRKKVVGRSRPIARKRFVCLTSVRQLPDGLYLKAIKQTVMLNVVGMPLRMPRVHAHAQFPRPHHGWKIQSWWRSKRSSWATPPSTNSTSM
jgi:Tfp pilus assembly protein PilN